MKIFFGNKLPRIKRHENYQKPQNAFPNCDLDHTPKGFGSLFSVNGAKSQETYCVSNV